MTHGAEQLRRLRMGLVATAAVSVLTGAIWGRLGFLDGIAVGMLATAMQLLAAQAMWRTGVQPSVDHLAVYALGMGLRALGVGILAVLTIYFPSRFAPGPSAVGYLGAVLPLLYLETRFSR